jgi:hypothetical protein
MKATSPKQKGLITAALIILLSGITYYFRRNFDNEIMLVAYFVYAAGIVWTLLAYHRQKDQPKNFKAYFQQGFSCFIVVTLMMVCATWLFLKFNTALQDEMVAYQRTQLQQLGNYSAPDIEEKLKQYRKILLPGYTIGAILSYLGIGALISSLLSVFLSSIKKAE